ncbi:MAG: hypothetical protein OEY36_01885 [Gammaproteobacteria bacterium]|nr:hypothetical protein [Gammaproteobacteria bacterium]
MFPTVEIDKNGIFIESHVDEFVTVDLALYIAEQRKILAGKEKKPLLVLFKKMLGFDPKTRNYTDQILENVNALAFYISCDNDEGKKTKEIMESFYKITPYPLPVMIFDDKSKAIDWLKTFV